MRTPPRTPWTAVAMVTALCGCATASNVENSGDAESSDLTTSLDVAVTAPDAGGPEAGADAADDRTPPMVVMDATDATSDAVSDAASDAAGDAVSDAADASPTCGAAQVLCAGECATVATDARHCGACGHACAPGERCAAGTCQLSCPTGQAACMGGDGVAQCVTLATDRLHCGMCGGACASGQSCMAGRCVTSCPVGQVACVNAGVTVCADLQQDERNCGSCNTGCLPTESCVMGLCHLDCPVGQTACVGRCVDTATDAANCGMCGRQCPTGQGCTAGRCALVCPAGQTVCAGACVNTGTDARNCGACGTVCAAGMVCTSGSCALACRAPTTACAGACVNTSTDVRNCGACANACPTGASATATCVLGRCGLACLAGRGNCDGLSTNGCEVDLTTSATSCGACGRACAVGAPCAMGVCATRRVIEDFEATWPHAPWTSPTSIPGTTLAGCAHDGTRGVQNPDWMYRTDLTVGAVGQKLSVWVRGGGGRFYLGFGADSTGAWSLVFCPNTSVLEFQRNASFGYTTLSNAAYTYSATVWYRLEVTFSSATMVTGTLYAADGITALRTVSASVAGFVPRGVAVRSFGGVCGDTVELR